MVLSSSFFSHFYHFLIFLFFFINLKILLFFLPLLSSFVGIAKLEDRIHRFGTQTLALNSLPRKKDDIRSSREREVREIKQNQRKKGRMSSSNSPCAACKFLRRKCTQECVFAPYFPPDQPQKFANVHKVFGASNVAKLLNDLNASQREDAVNSLAYEAEARLRDPVYGCVGLISILQHRLKQMQIDLFNAKKELANYIGPSAMLPILQHPGFMQQHPNNPSSSVIPYNMQPMLGSQLMIREPQQQQQHQQQHQQMLEAQQLAAVVAAREQHQMLRNYEQQQQHTQHAELVSFNSGFETEATGHGFSQMSAAAALSPSLALGSYDNPYQNQQIQLRPQLLLQQHPQQPQTPHQHQQQRAGSEEGRSVDPSC